MQQANDGLKRVAGALLPAGPQQPQEHTVMVDVDEQDQILRVFLVSYSF